jgi:mitochondrial-processing peptidase subunit alpha
MIEWQKQQYVPEKLVVAGLGIQHQKFLEIVNNTFGKIPASRSIQVNDNASMYSPYLPAYDPPANYVGGELFVQDDRKSMDPTLFPPYERFDASVFLAFEAPSHYAAKDFYCVCLLLSLMGSGGSFSSGGPGKGMYSRTYTDILCYGYIESASTFHMPYSDTGLFGICIHGRQNHVLDIIELAVLSMKKMAKIQPEEFERAKNQLKSALFSNLETRSVILEDLQRQTLLYNKYYEMSDHVSQIDSLTIAEVETYAANMLTQKPPTFVVYAEEDYVQSLPPAEKIHNYFKERI